ncbi:winged helix-turn-helix transcriptional regulator [Halorarius litoreus]|uniref:winged helix-turn-helix transcriptional regulator n=1 Tax=Halorarius litoreus TaxID=2962676 RepID=UPI0020CD673B|nr:winged helix-turn-helix transcriptional regulator [Halorarius litoreus]
MSVDRLRPADRRILEHLRDNPPNYIALIANRLGMPTGYVDRRRAVLVEQGFIEPVTAEAIYRLTEAGEAYLERSQPAVGSPDSETVVDADD